MPDLHGLAPQDPALTAFLGRVVEEARPEGRATARSPQDGVGALDRSGKRLCGEPFWVRRVKVRLLLKCELNRGPAGLWWGLKERLSAAGAKFTHGDW
jgi:hypothetical protein